MTTISCLTKSELASNPQLLERMTTIRQLEIDSQKEAVHVEALRQLHQVLLLPEPNGLSGHFLGSLSAGYSELISKLWIVDPLLAVNCHLGASVIFVPEIADHIQGLQSLAATAGLSAHPDVILKSRLLASLPKDAVCVVELMDPFPVLSLAETPTQGSLLFSRVSPSAETPEEKGNNGAFACLLASTRMARQGKSANITLVGFNHIEVTKALNAFVYRQNLSCQRLNLPVMYSDGSQARPFPLYALDMPNQSERDVFDRCESLHVGMMSARHADGLDQITQMYWFQNYYLSQTRTEAETDEMAYQHTREMLEQLPGNSLRIYFYQTGMVPVVIGFWRAVVEYVIAHRDAAPRLQIVPMFADKRSGKYERGRCWC